VKYENEYKISKNKKDFVRLLLKLYKYLDKTTPIKRYYDLRKEFGELPFTKRIEIKRKEIVEIIDENIDIVKPTHLKMLLLQDMKRLRIVMSKEYLRRYGFKEGEIVWIMKMKMKNNMRLGEKHGHEQNN